MESSDLAPIVSATDGGDGELEEARQRTLLVVSLEKVWGRGALSRIVRTELERKDRWVENKGL